MRFLGSFVGWTLGILMAIGCSSDDEVAGIEIGNPALALTADFSVDYSEVDVPVLLKGETKDEPVLLEDFSLQLADVRSYSSYYVYTTVDPVMGLQLWPKENSPDTSLEISFTDGASVEDTFGTFNLNDDGFLKELGVTFFPKSESSVIKGKLLIGKEYKPFEYSLGDFEKFTLRYHFSQVEWVSDTVVNLSVVFRPRYFIEGLDLSSAKESKDGVIRFNSAENDSLWNELNSRFLSGFQSLRYQYMDESGKEVCKYVDDIWKKHVVAKDKKFVDNGDFSKGAEDWIFVRQFGGDADSSISTEKDGSHIMKIDVKKAGNYSYSVQLIHENIALVKGKKYKCVFTLWSNKEGQVTARIGSYATYETIGFQSHEKVSTSARSMEFEFVPNVSTAFARFELNMGSSVQTYFIKDVQIYQMDK